MKNFKIILSIILASFIITVLVFHWVRSYQLKDKTPKKELVSPQKAEPEPLRISKDKQWKVVSPPTRIRFTGEYGSVYKGVLPYSKISIENLTEPCCLMTRSGKEYCSNGTRNFEEKTIPDDTDNGQLRFKSQNGEVGYLNIYFWVPNN